MAFKIVNKSTDRSFRFQWSEHPYVVFEPSVGHIKYLTSKEIVATFLAPEPTNQENVRFQNETCCCSLNREQNNFQTLVIP